MRSQALRRRTITAIGIIGIGIFLARAAGPSGQLAPPAFATFFVSPTGSDSNPGTESEPFQTLSRAQTAVRSITPGMSGDVLVYLREGTHTLTSTLDFDVQDSGLNGFQVVYSAYPGETAVVSGGRPITGWLEVGGGLFAAPVGSLRFRQLYVNGNRAVRARTPDAGSYHRVVFWDADNRRVEVGRSEVGQWQRQNAVEMVILGEGVNQSNLRVASITGAVVAPLEPERTRLFGQAYPPKRTGRPYFFENALEFLNAPGEWYLNTDSNEVFYRPLPGETMASAAVVAPVLDRLIGVVGTLSSPVHDLQFRGLTFEHATWLLPDSEGYVGDQASIVFTEPLPADQISSYPGHRLPAAVHVEAANFVRFERNTFRHLGGSALNFYRAVSDSTVIGNVIIDVSGSGISIDLNLEGNPADSRLICRRNLISNNYIAGTGRDWYQSVGIMTGYTDSTTIEHNEVLDTPYSGITVGWGWDFADNAMRNNIVRYNNVYRTNQLMSDGGGIYTLSKQNGGLITENYVHDIARGPVQGAFNISGIYLDEGSGLIAVHDNVLVNTGDRPMFQHANGAGVSFGDNGGMSPRVIANAGLRAEYADIRPASAALAKPQPAARRADQNLRP